MAMSEKGRKEGISRVKQRPGDMKKGQSGKMGEGHKSSKRGAKHERHESRMHEKMERY